jgi:hypothetical protein
MCVTIDGVLGWMLDLLTTDTHDSELHAISTFQKSPQHPLKFSNLLCVLTSCSLATVSNSADSSASHAQVLSERRLPNASFSHRLLYRTDSVTPTVLLITLRTDRVENTVSNSTSIVACVFVSAGICLPSRCPETNVVSEPFASNGCFYGYILSKILKLWSSLW